MRDEGLSAFHERHVKKGALGVFLKAIDDGQVPVGSFLIVEGLDRLSRAEPIQAQAQLTAIISAGISVVTASDNKVYSREKMRSNPMDLVYSLLVMIRAHEESDTKSKRTRDAIRRRCQGWQDGSFRGVIRSGQTPGWLRLVDGRWEFVEERLQAIRIAIDLFSRGFGSTHIVRTLHAQGLSTGACATHGGQILRLLANPALLGEKHLEVEGESFVMQDYYPAVLDRAAWDALQLLLASRSTKHVKSTMPSLLTGYRVTHCGYCGWKMKSQVMLSRRRADGTLADGCTRLQCSSFNHGGGCSVPGSCAGAPVERALMRYCSDMVNLRALYGGDLSTMPRIEFATATAALAKIDQQLKRLTNALMETDDAPVTFMRRARELEAERDAARLKVAHAQTALNKATRADITGADEKWGALIDGVSRLDVESRMKARQLFADTFESIVIYRRGIRPDETPAGCVDVVLKAKGGSARLLRIDKKGELVFAEHFTEEAMDSPVEVIAAGSLTGDAVAADEIKPARRKRAKRVREAVEA